MSRVEPTIIQPVGLDDYPTKREFVAAQSAWRDAFDSLYTLTPWADGRLMEDVSLVPFVDNVINHGLGRKLRGWTIVRDRGAECFFEAYAGGATSIGVGGAQVNLNTESYDYGGNFSTSTNLFTAPFDGLYSFSWHVLLVTLTDIFVDGRLRVNGTTRYTGSATRGSSATSYNAGSGASKVTSLDEGDTVDLFAYHDDGVASYNTSTGLSDVHLSGRLIRETWDDQANNSTTDKTLVLQTTYGRDVDLVVF